MDLITQNELFLIIFKELVFAAIINIHNKREAVMNKIKLLPGILFLLILTNSCSNSTEPIKLNFDTITRTTLDRYGHMVIIYADPTDWLINLTPQPDFIIDDSGQFSTFITPAYPNPSTDSIRIKFSLSLETNVHFEIIDENRNLVKTLMDESQHAGYYTVTWNLDDNNGSRVKTGFYRCNYSWEAVVFEKGSNQTHSQIVQVTGYGDIQVE